MDELMVFWGGAGPLHDVKKSLQGRGTRLSSAPQNGDWEEEH